MNSADLGPAAEVPGDHRGGVVVSSDPQVQRANPTSNQPGVKRPEYRTDVQRCHPDLIDQVLGSDDDSCGCVRMPGQIFRRAVPDQVDAELQGSLIDRGREGVVSQSHDPVRSRDIRHGAQVGDFQTRVARRLDQEQSRRRVDRSLPRCSVGLIHERVVHTEAWEQLLDKAEGAAIHAALSHHVLPRFTSPSTVVASAPIPDPNTRPVSAPSNVATASAISTWFGFPWRV